MEHVRTQLPYGLFVAALALLFAYFPSALGLAPAWSLVLAILVMICVLLVFVRRYCKTN
jgi:Na+/H+ antiporter NhaC